MIFNNNVVLARGRSGREVVLTGRGLGFQAKPGQRVDPAKVARVFEATDGNEPTELGALLAEIPPEHVALAGEALDLARVELGHDLRAGLVVPLADHLSFAIKRARNQLTMDYPLRAEVAHLYPRELAVAQQIVALVNSRIDVALPADEAVAVTLHLVNASFATADLAGTFQMTDVFQQILEVIASSFDQVDRHGVAAARFITHLRYFFIRMHDGVQHTGQTLPYSDAVTQAYPAQYQCALRVQSILELRLGQPITDEEIVYLTMHIARLTDETR